MQIMSVVLFSLFVSVFVMSLLFFFSFFLNSRCLLFFVCFSSSFWFAIENCCSLFSFVYSHKRYTFSRCRAHFRFSSTCCKTTHIHTYIYLHAQCAPKCHCFIRQRKCTQVLQTRFKVYFHTPAFALAFPLENVGKNHISIATGNIRIHIYMFKYFPISLQFGMGEMALFTQS